MAEQNRTQEATLGCGTLILIGLVVLFFSRPGLRDIEEEIGKLRQDVKTRSSRLLGMSHVSQEEIGKLRDDVKALQKSMDEQTRLLQALKAKAKE